MSFLTGNPRPPPLLTTTSPSSYVSVKAVVQAGIFLAAIVLIIKITCSSHPRTMSEFRDFLASVDTGAPVWQSKAALRLPPKGSVFCWVLPSSSDALRQLDAINDTWLGECDHGEIFTTEPTTEMAPAAAAFANFPEEPDQQIWKHVYALHFISSRLSLNFDWIVKADDDAYVFMPALRRYLAQFSPAQLLYFCMYEPEPSSFPKPKTGVYVLSRAAVQAFLNTAYLNDSVCPMESLHDNAFVWCLQRVGVRIIDTRDVLGRQRFAPFGLSWIFDRRKNGGGTFDAFSRDLVSIHPLAPNELRTLHFAMHHLDRRARIRRNRQTGDRLFF